MKYLTEDQYAELAAGSMSSITCEGDVAAFASALVARAAELGVVLTIEQRAVEPLAMGNYSTVVETRAARTT